MGNRQRARGFSMLSTNSTPWTGTDRNDPLRLHTLILLRWMAIGGQVIALIVASRFFDVVLPQGFCYLTVGASVAVNLILMYIFPENRRLTETGALLTLLFDVTQLAVLLFLTGGLTNPFALLILAPVTISATALRLRSTFLLGFCAVMFVTLVFFYNLPIRLLDGTILTVPRLFEFGFWLSLMIGIAFLGLYTRRVTVEIRYMSDALFAAQMALAREQKLTDLGGVVAAAAHELGTPLATIKLVSTELMDELKDQPDLLTDVRLIRDQADRCRDILRSMGRAGKDDLHLRQAPFSAVVREAAEPHISRGKVVQFEFHPAIGSTSPQPQVFRRPEVIHGIRNLVQNAVDFAQAKVWVEGCWSDKMLSVRIVDDGEGFPAQLLGRIGDPFVRSRKSGQSQAQRPEYESMGLGLFIAKTLLERTGAELRFANGADPFLSQIERPERGGAIVEVIWSSKSIFAEGEHAHGENQPIPSW